MALPIVIPRITAQRFRCRAVGFRVNMALSLG